MLKILFFGSHVWFLISKSLPFEEELSPSVSISIISYLFNLANILWRQIVTWGCKPSINVISLNRYCIIIADHFGYPNSNYVPFGILARNPRNQVFHGWFVFQLPIRISTVDSYFNQSFDWLVPRLIRFWTTASYCIVIAPVPPDPPSPNC